MKRLDYMSPHDGPVIDGFESQEVVYGARQREYVPLRTLRSKGPFRAAISRWSLTPEQRQAVAGGADIFLELMTFGQPLQPVRLAVSDGRLDPRYVKLELLQQDLTPDEMESLTITIGEPTGGM